MSDFDHSSLDGHLLQLLVAVHEEGAITRAALRLGVTQSAVSHLLDKLRAIVGDPLFVRSGRGIVPTTRADALVPMARRLLEDMRGFVTSGGFDPARFEGLVTIAANDLQRDLLLPPLFDRLRRQAPGLRLHVIPSGVPTPELLRDGRCTLVLTPRPPEGGDLVHKRLFEDQYQVFYDATQREAPNHLEDYLAAEHVTVVYEPRRALDLDDALNAQGVVRNIVATVPGFAGIPAFLRGSARIATVPGLLSVGVLGGLARCHPPLPCSPMPMFMVWHVRHQNDDLHSWLRQAVVQVAESVPSGARPASQATIQLSPFGSTRE
ncbi:MAG: LysR family transcriptional regulator [Burkholderiales bacterium]|nr:LysR family transcriptional regulator [Burkholderiales bacterium]